MDDVTSLASAPGPDKAGEVTVRYWAGAAAAAGLDSERVAADTVGQLRVAILERHPGMASVLGRCSVLVAGARVDDDARLRPDVTVEILPPFAGG